MKIADRLESIEIFPIPVFRIVLEGVSDELGLEEIVRSHILKTTGLQGIYNYSGGGASKGSALQSNPSLHTLDEMQPFNEKIVEVMGTVIDQHGIHPEYAIEITSMWGNIQPSGHSFHRHSHHNNVFAGVYYVNEAENTGIANRLKGFPHILFWNDRKNNQLSPIRNYNHRFNRYNFPVKTSKDLLVIFPAWLEHEVGENISSKDRISISFNIMLRGRFGEINSKESSII